jgi:PHD/YefM family antitoxin component YafN of YafNO toxin-antitoxin module
MGILPFVAPFFLETDMALPLNLDAVDALPRAPATDVKRLGWRGVMKAVAKSGKLVVTNHNHPEAVILSLQEYVAIVTALAASAEDAPLEALRKRFDARLAALQVDEAGDRLRAVARDPARLHGQVKAGRDT